MYKFELLNKITSIFPKKKKDTAPDFTGLIEMNADKLQGVIQRKHTNNKNLDPHEEHLGIGA